MHTRIKFILLSLSISLLPACTNMIGNVVPEKGPTMEEVYDSMEPEKTSTLKTSLPIQVNDNAFHQLPNPQLKMYVYPHFAGNEEQAITPYLMRMKKPTMP